MKDVWAYLRLENGKIVSTMTSRTATEATVEIDVPPRYAIVRRLLSQRRGAAESPLRATYPSKEQRHRRWTDSWREVEKVPSRKPTKDTDLVELIAMVPAFDIPLLIRRSDLKWFNT